MKTTVRDEYGSGDALRLEDLEKPRPGDHEVLVQVRAASVNTTDIDQRRGKTPHCASRHWTGPAEVETSG